MKRREFAKDILLASIAVTVSPILVAGKNEDKISSFLKIVLNDLSPQFDFFSIDSLGKNKLANNLILHDPAWIKHPLIVKKNLLATRYFTGETASHKLPVWEIKTGEKGFVMNTQYQQSFHQPFLFNIEQHANHATLLGMMQGSDNKISLPAILHLPDMGTMRVSANAPNIKIDVTAMRFIEHPYVRLELPPASAINKKIVYSFEVVAIHPVVKGIDNDSRFDCYRKNFISIFQLNPFLKILANNTSSDACAFTLFKYATVAAHTPLLANGMRANDLVRMTLDRYLDGQKGYGILGYDYGKEWVIPESPTTCHSLDSYPSLLMSACIYTNSSKDTRWFNANYEKIKTWSQKILSMDKDDDGLVEYCLPGNSGSWKGDKTQRPANWWDTIGFGHKDAYSNALAYQALVLFEKTIRKHRTGTDADFFKAKAEKLKAVYTTTFLNPTTGILAGWKSADGKLHDYYFIFVNTVAISYGLIEDGLANSIMDKLLLKMKEVGYTNFELGLPGNLIPVIRADYTDLLLEVGGGKREDNLDGFQIYENGGATACFTYFTINALQKLRRKKDADSILLPLLKSMSEGNFQGRGANGRTKDWKTWTGECWGYEGFLVDNYMFLLTVLTRNNNEYAP